MTEPTPDDNAKSEPVISPNTVEESKAIVEDSRPLQETEVGSKDTIDEQIKRWQTESGKDIKEEVSEFGYHVVDLSETSPEEALSFLRFIASQQEVVFHGMHDNELRRRDGMPDVQPWESLDPSFSHQDEDRKAVYATKSLEGGIAHATIEHKPEDIHDDETYALKMSLKDEKLVEVSPQLHERILEGGEVFTEGLLYVLPAETFHDTNNSNHEVNAQKEVKPILVVKISGSLGRSVITPESTEVRGGK